MSHMDTLAALKSAMKTAAALPEDIAKSFTQSGVATAGLTFYDIAPAALMLVPVNTPLRNAIARIVGGRGIQANWKAITGLNAGRQGIGLSEGLRGPVQQTATADYLAAFRFLGLDDNYTFEAEFSAEGLVDMDALAKRNLLTAVMIEEEKLDLAGNTSVALGTTPTPVLSALAGGSLANSQISVICVALTHEAYNRSSVSSGIPETVNRNLAGGASDSYKGGHAQKSAAATITPTLNYKVRASVTPVNGAVAYAWFWGASGSEVLGAITTLNSVEILTTATGTQPAASKFTTDQSANDKVYDGLLYQALKPGSGSYVKKMDSGTAGTGTPLTGDNAGGIDEIDEMLESMWSNHRLWPDTLWVAGQEQKSIQKKILASGANAAQRFVFTTDQRGMTGGVIVKSYLSKFGPGGAKEIEIKLHPDMPDGTMLATSMSVPYPLNGIPQMIRKLLRRDYYAIDWPLSQRKKEFGVYFDGVLQHFFPPSMGVITNIGAD